MKKIMILIIIIIVCSLLFSGCIDTSEISNDLTKKMTIVTFNVIPSIIELGQNANLSWVVTGSDTTVNIDNGIGDVSLTGYRIITPTETTIYTLTATNSSSTKNVTTQIIVTIINDTQPDIGFSADYNAKRIVVTKSYSGLSWDDIQIVGTATKPTGSIIAGDLITGCSGTVTISWQGIYLYGSWIFTEDTPPNIAFAKSNNYLIVTKADSGLKWSDFTITGEYDDSLLGEFVLAGDIIGNCSGTISIIHNPTNSLIGTWLFIHNDKEIYTPNIAFTKTNDRLTVSKADSNIDWNDFQLTWDTTASSANLNGGPTIANGNVIAPEGTTIYAGDYLKMTYTAMTVYQIRHIPTNSLIGTWTFAV